MLELSLENETNTKIEKKLKDFKELENLLSVKYINI